MKSYAFPILISYAAVFLMGKIDTQMLVILSDVRAVGLYETGLSIAQIAGVMVVPITKLLVPTTVSLLETKQHKLLNSILVHVYKYTCIGLVPVIIFIVAFPSTILSVVFGTGYIPAATALVVLTITQIFTPFVGINNNLLTGLGKVRERTRIIIIAVCA